MNNDRVNWTACVCVCLLVHSVATFMLALEIPRRFEVEADRPQRSWGVFPKPSKDKSDADGESPI
jgi:hypothetical protein